MGIPVSLLRKAGLPGVESLATDQVYNNYFKDVKNALEFQSAFIAFCNDLNTVLPGKHYKVKASQDEMEKAFKDWKEEQVQKKEKLIEFMKNNVEEHKPNEKAMILTGTVAPPVAIYLKKAGENTPQLKKFRLHLIPNFVFAPTCTLLALAGVRLLQLKSTTPPKTKA